MSELKNISIPLYKQIKTYLETIISQNHGDPTFQLPSENQIAQKFNSSRVPVIQALKALEDEGKIYRLQGKGSFIRTSTTNSRKTLFICMVLPSIQSHFVNEIVKGAEQYLKPLGARLFISVTDDLTEKEAEIIESVQEMQFHGLLFFPALHNVYSDAILNLAINKFPTVFIARNMSQLNISSVFSNPYNQVYHAVEHLISKGHREIGFLGDPAENSVFYDKRMRGYKEAVRRYFPGQLPHTQEVDFYSGNLEEEIYHSVVSFFENAPAMTACITNNLALVHIHRYFKEYQVPAGKYTVMFFDSAENMEFLSNQELILIDQSPFKIGYLAAEQLYQQIIGNRTLQNIDVPERFIEISRRNG